MALYNGMRLAFCLAEGTGRNAPHPGARSDSASCLLHLFCSCSVREFGANPAAGSHFPSLSLRMCPQAELQTAGAAPRQLAQPRTPGMGQRVREQHLVRVLAKPPPASRVGSARAVRGLDSPDPPVRKRCPTVCQWHLKHRCQHAASQGSPWELHLLRRSPN